MAKGRKKPDNRRTPMNTYVHRDRPARRPDVEAIANAMSQTARAVAVALAKARQSLDELRNLLGKT